MNLWEMPQIVGSFYFLKYLKIIDQINSLFVLVMRGVFKCPKGGCSNSLQGVFIVSISEPFANKKSLLSTDKGDFFGDVFLARRYATRLLL